MYNFFFFLATGNTGNGGVASLTAGGTSAGTSTAGTASVNGGAGTGATSIGGAVSVNGGTSTGATERLFFVHVLIFVS